ncbi:hypothetical protein psal_cds_494 [Pandoravirus salinus]|uniref:F-box domain containing protein n=1 Tax=Pandoravirus salinus TaxID=1349410 RepID=S4VXT8_9VIRU|nr:hypothetical protein psal_cds_494 [Pandoravirus salinus]AGO84281.2 hypothetical protein psal_cds_494 [Pandoravirus salinus]
MAAHASGCGFFAIKKKNDLPTQRRPGADTQDTPMESPRKRRVAGRPTTLSARASPVRQPANLKKKKRTRTTAGGDDTDGSTRRGRAQHGPDGRERGARLDDLPRELVWAIATHVDAAGVIAMASVSRHLAASVDGTLRRTAVDQCTLLRRLRLFVLCVSRAVAAGYLSAVRFGRPFVAGDLRPRECVMAIARGESVHWVWMTTRGESICYGAWHCATQVASNHAHLLTLYQHMMVDGAADCVMTSNKEPPGGSATEHALWTAATGSHPPQDLDRKLQKQKGLGPCDRVAPARDVWARWSADPAAAEAFVRETAPCPLLFE